MYGRKRLPDLDILDTVLERRRPWVRSPRCQVLPDVGSRLIPTFTSILVVLRSTTPCVLVRKRFSVFLPTEHNLQLYESLVLKGTQNFGFLSTRLAANLEENCHLQPRFCRHIIAGHCYPCGWIHASTPVDSIVIGGNFLAHESRYPKSASTKLNGPQKSAQISLVSPDSTESTLARSSTLGVPFSWLTTWTLKTTF